MAPHLPPFTKGSPTHTVDSNIVALSTSKVPLSPSLALLLEPQTVDITVRFLILALLDNKGWERFKNLIAPPEYPRDLEVVSRPGRSMNFAREKVDFLR
jgi:hypothetical protein